MSASHVTLTWSFVDIDPEDVQIKGIDSEDDAPDDPSAARAHYVDVEYVVTSITSPVLIDHDRPSLLRKAHDHITDPKYESIRTSRKALMEDQSATGDSEVEEKDQDEDIDSQVEDEGNEVDECDTRGQDDYDHQPPLSEDEVESSELEQGLPAEEYSRKPPPSDVHNDLSSSLRQKREEDRRKGKAISRQIV